MYGFIHCALEDLLVTKYGRETWEKVLRKSGVKLRGGSFLIHKVYGDDVTMKLIHATAEVLDIGLDECLEAFGQNFLAFCQRHGYDKILKVLGSNLEDFLTNLDNLHDHLAASYPGMKAPSFRTVAMPDGSLGLYYYSKRRGLEAIVRGLVKVVAKEFFDVEVIVETKDAGEKEHRSYVFFHIHEARREASSSFTGFSRFRATSGSYRLRKETERLPIGVRTFCRAFPFHVMFQRDFLITQIGNSLMRFTRKIWRKYAGMVAFTDLFKICRPVIDCTFDAILDHQNMVFVVTSLDGVMSDSTAKLRLKGQMIWVPESQSVLFLCSPRVTGLDQMKSMGVYFSDFPIHDRGRDLVLLGHHRKGERELVEKLDEASNHLKVLDTKLREDKKRTEELLQSIFPGHVAKKLCQSQTVEAERFDVVTCLFSDIVGFTAMCGTARPIDVVRFLNRLYLQFDSLTSLHDVYKVETIGDAYIVVSGVPNYVSNHADRIIEMALAMVEVTKYITAPIEGTKIEIRVGVHTGPVVAGVLGVKTPRYSLLGNTVTVANQLETRSKPGLVTISEETKRCLKEDHYIFEDNPNTTDLPIPGVFVSKDPSARGATDISAALSVSAATGGGLFRSPTSSPGHSDGMAEGGSNSPSLQSPSPHLTFKGAVSVPRIDIPPHIDVNSPQACSSPLLRPSRSGRYFVFPPQTPPKCFVGKRRYFPYDGSSQPSGSESDKKGPIDIDLAAGTSDAKQSEDVKNEAKYPTGEKRGIKDIAVPKVVEYMIGSEQPKGLEEDPIGEDARKKDPVTFSSRIIGFGGDQNGKEKEKGTDNKPLEKIPVMKPQFEQKIAGHDLPMDAGIHFEKCSFLGHKLVQPTCSDGTLSDVAHIEEEFEDINICSATNLSEPEEAVEGAAGFYLSSCDFQDQFLVKIVSGSQEQIPEKEVSALSLRSFTSQADESYAANFSQDSSIRDQSIDLMPSSSFHEVSLNILMYGDSSSQSFANGDNGKSGTTTAPVQDTSSITSISSDMTASQGEDAAGVAPGGASGNQDRLNSFWNNLLNPRGWFRRRPPPPSEGIEEQNIPSTSTGRRRRRRRNRLFRCLCTESFDDEDEPCSYQPAIRVQVYNDRAEPIKPSFYKRRRWTYRRGVLEKCRLEARV